MTGTPVVSPIDAPRPAYTAADAVRLASELYGLEASADELPAELDRNFLLTSADGRKWVLKVSPGDADRSALEAQVQVLRFLESGGLGGRVPGVVSADGVDVVFVPGPPGHGCWVRLLSFLVGEKLVGLPLRPPRLLEELGRFLGRLDRLLLDFDHPGAHRTIPWDMARLDRLAGSLDRVDDPRRRQLVGRWLDRFRSGLLPEMGRLRRSVVHNDANDHNILVSSSDPEAAEVCGLIDFGDMVHTVTVAEVAIAAAYAMLGADDPLAAGGRVITGYHSALPLTAGERSALFDLVVARLCQSVLIAARRRQLAADNEYLLVSERPVWDLLESLSTIDPDRANERLVARTLGVGDVPSRIP